MQAGVIRSLTVFVLLAELPAGWLQGIPKYSMSNGIYISPARIEMETALEARAVSSLEIEEKVSALKPTGAAAHKATTMNVVPPKPR